MAKVAQYDVDSLFIGTTEDYGGLLPFGCALDFPPEEELGENQRWRRVGPNQFNKAYDFRGREGFINGEKMTIRSYGPLPDGWSDDPPAKQLTLAEAKDEAITSIDARTNALLEQYGLPFGGRNFALTDKARLNYREVESALTNATEFRALGYMTEENFAAFFPVSFQTLDGGEYAFSNPLELQSFFLALGTYQANPASPWATGRTLKAAVNAAIAVGEVEAIVDDRS